MLAPLALAVLWTGTAARILAEGETLVDRIVAVVDEDPIFLSDIRRALVVGLDSAPQGTLSREAERRVLQDLIDQRLRQHEVDRYETLPVPSAQLDAQIERIRARFPDADTFRSELAGQGLDEERLRHHLAQQLRVLRYIEERLGPRVFVSLEDIRTFHQQEYAARLAARGEALPPLDAELREALRSELRERGLNEEIEEWTHELRLEADILDFFERPPGELPPVVERFEN